MNDSIVLKNVNITIENNTDIKQFISQFQIHCKQLLCVVNDKIIRYYSKKDELPKNIKYLRDNTNEYYFEDLDTQDVYCIYGKISASVFYPILKEKDKEIEPIIVTYSNKSPKLIIIYHHNKKTDIKWNNRQVEIKEGDLFKY